MTDLSQLTVLATRKDKTIYRDGDTVLKVFGPSYAKSGILNEALNHARIEETGLSVPTLEEVLMIDGKWTIRFEYVEGKTLAEMMADEPDRSEEYLNRFVAIQCDIFEQRAPLLNKLSDKTGRKIDISGFDATTRYDLHMRLESMPAHVKICHGDFVPSNIMIRPDGTHAILDWSHVTQGNASADAALTYLLFMLDGKEDLAERYLARFCAVTDTARQYVQRWMPLVAAAQSVKNKPDEVEFLHRWVNVVEYE